LLEESDGAQCVFPPAFETGMPANHFRSSSRNPTRGTATAATTWPQSVTGSSGWGLPDPLRGRSPQSQHLQMVFGRGPTWPAGLPEGVDAVHVAFGSVLGPDNKMFKSRSGESVKLDAAARRSGRAGRYRHGRTRVGHAKRSTGQRRPRTLGIGAVKYADLSTERHRDYVFDWDPDAGLRGQHGSVPPIAPARIRSIFRRGNVTAPEPAVPVTLVDPDERSVVLQLLGFGEAVAASLQATSPIEALPRTSSIWRRSSPRSTRTVRCCGPPMTRPGVPAWLLSDLSARVWPWARIARHRCPERM